MLRHLEQARASGMLGQLVRFGVTGVGLTLLYAAIYWPLATYVVPPVLAVVIAFVIAASVGNVAHSRFSFRDHGTRDDPRRIARRSFAVQLFGFVLNASFTWVLTGPPLHGPTWWPLVPALFVTPVATFLLQRGWVYG